MRRKEIMLDDAILTNSLKKKNKKNIYRDSSR